MSLLVRSAVTGPVTCDEIQQLVDKILDLTYLMESIIDLQKSWRRDRRLKTRLMDSFAIAIIEGSTYQSMLLANEPSFRF